MAARGALTLTPSRAPMRNQIFSTVSYTRRPNVFIGGTRALAHKAGCSHVLVGTGSSVEDLVPKQFRSLKLAR